MTACGVPSSSTTARLGIQWLHPESLKLYIQSLLWGAESMRLHYRVETPTYICLEFKSCTNIEYVTYHLLRGCEWEYQQHDTNGTDLMKRDWSFQFTTEELTKGWTQPEQLQTSTNSKTKRLAKTKHDKQQTTRIIWDSMDYDMNTKIANIVCSYSTARTMAEEKSKSKTSSLPPAPPPPPSSIQIQCYLVVAKPLPQLDKLPCKTHLTISQPALFAAMILRLAAVNSFFRCCAI